MARYYELDVTENEYTIYRIGDLFYHVFGGSVIISKRIYDSTYLLIFAVYVPNAIEIIVEDD